MKPRVIGIAVVCATLLLACFISTQSVLAQDQDAPAKKNIETNLDTYLYLIVATNQEVPDEKMPAALEPVVRQLRGTLPFKNYRVSATLINRVKNEGRLNLKWIGGPLVGTAPPSDQTPTFNEFRVNIVRLVTNAEGQQMVHMEGFAFGARVPIKIGGAVASNTSTAPIVNYESTGLNTDISMREGEAVVVGTLNVGPSGEAIILVMSAKRTMR